MAVQIPSSVDLRKYIDTSLFGERPHIRGRRVPVATVAYSAQSEGWGTSELAYQFTLNEAEVLSALLYYQEHKAEIDAQEAEEQHLLDEMYQLHGEQ
ncbi:MAG: DUF433 domain-containing protein [Anaerolineae bacterium]|nr:DUF433 domain-containing protein [Anaerolineae bacterium]